MAELLPSSGPDSATDLQCDLGEGTTAPSGSVSLCVKGRDIYWEEQTGKAAWKEFCTQCGPGFLWGSIKVCESWAGLSGSAVVCSAGEGPAWWGINPIRSPPGHQ